MLSLDKRLNLKTDFKRVIKGDRRETPNFKFFYLSLGTGLPRVGISLSKQYFKKAVLRNKARRLTSVGVEQIYNDLPEGLNLIIMPKSGVLEISRDELLLELKGVLLK